MGNNADVTVFTTDIPVVGANNHNFDFGFGAVTCVTPQLSPQLPILLVQVT